MTLPLPGWYQDPLNPDRQKWWDGAAWTEYTVPLASGTAAESGEAAAPASDGGTAAEPAAEGFAGFGAPAPAAEPYPQPFPQPYTGSSDHPGYTDQPVNPGYSGYQRGYAGSHPAYTGYPGYPGYASAQGSNPAALTGFILGIAAFFMFFIPFLGTVVSLGAGVFSAVGLAKQGPDRAPMYKVFAVIGLILGIIFTILSALILVAVFALMPLDSGTTSTTYSAFQSS